MSNTYIQIEKHMAWGLVGWYDFKSDDNILYIGSTKDVYFDFFKENRFSASVVDIDALSDNWINENFKAYDIVICIAYLEQVSDPVAILGKVKKVMTSRGHLLLGMNNRLGSRYFCGDRDPYTGECFEGIEGYVNERGVRHSKGRCYCRNEIKQILSKSGWGNNRFYSVLPGLENATIILGEDYTPNEDLSGRVFPSYNDPESIFMKEEGLYPVLVKEGLLHAMANAYLIDCTIEGDFSEVLQVTSSIQRGEDNALYTIIYSDGKVVKRPIYEAGRAKLDKMQIFSGELEVRGINVVAAKVRNGALEMPFIDCKTVQDYFKTLLYKDIDLFLSEMDRFRDTVLKSSEISILEDGTEVFEKGYFDLVPLNCFYKEGEFQFFDQEFCIEKLPVKVMAWRQVASFYFGDPEAEKRLSMSILLERYGLKEELTRWQSIEWGFLGDLLKNDELAEYHNRTRTNTEKIIKRREKMDRRMQDILDGVEEKNLYLFGAGRYTELFLDLYSREVRVAGIVDNDEKKVGHEKNGIIIVSPSMLQQLDRDKLKVIICMKDYYSASRQLEGLGIRDYGIFNPGLFSNPKKLHRIIINQKTSAIVNSKYHIGYVAGAFDMFHIGHLNLLRRAKARCDYLVAGVMSDEKMYDLKGKMPVIPCNERMQVVAGCRYVDEVIELPIDRAGISDAYEMVHFDCMFSGDDHANDPGWLAERENMRRRGSDIVFVPYTKEQSSSDIRKKMKRSKV